MTNHTRHTLKNPPVFKPENMGALAFEIFNIIMENHKKHPEQLHLSIPLNQIPSFSQNTEPAIINKPLWDATEEIQNNAIIFKKGKATKERPADWLLAAYFTRLGVDYDQKTLEVRFGEAALRLV